MQRKRLLIFPLLVLFLLVVSPFAQADSFTFTTIPASGSVEGPAGSTIGWGYSITNASTTNWLVTSAFSAGTFLNGTPLSLLDYPILAPLATVTVPFDVMNGLGLYQLTWDAAAPVGFVNADIFTVSAEWWDGDPFAGGNFLQSADDLSAAYSATVSPTTVDPSPVPEPSTFLLLAIGLGTMCVVSRMRA